MGYKYDESEILRAAVDICLADGISKLSFGRLAKHMGVADRSIVHYFPTEADLLSQCVSSIGAQL